MYYVKDLSYYKDTRHYSKVVNNLITKAIVEDNVLDSSSVEFYLNELNKNINAYDLNAFKIEMQSIYQIKALNNSMNHTEASEILNEIQSSFDISKMGYLDQNLWPPIRNRIASKLVKKNITKKGDNNLFVDFCNSFIFCFFNKPKIKDVIIISDGLYSVKIKNATHDRVMYNGVIKNNTELGHSIEKIFLDKLTDSKFINYSSAFIF